jgi:hypothetical protein
VSQEIFRALAADHANTVRHGFGALFVFFRREPTILFAGQLLAELF